MDMVEELRGRYSCAVSSALEDAEVGSKNMLSSIDCMCLVFIHRKLQFSNHIYIYIYEMPNYTRGFRFITT